jgi:hypothetical protein
MYTRKALQLMTKHVFGQRPKWGKLIDKIFKTDTWSDYSHFQTKDSNDTL